jgi:hypothetical protein
MARFVGSGHEAIALCRHCDYESRRIGVVSQRAPYLAHRGVDGVIDIKEEVLAPNSFENFLTRHEMSAPVDQQQQQIEGNAFKLHRTAPAPELVGTPVKLVFRKTTYIRRHLNPRNRAILVALQTTA